MRVSAAAILVLLLLQGCAGTGGEPQTGSYRMTENGTMVWQEEYAFLRPSGTWQFLPLGEDHTLGFFRLEGHNTFSQTSFAYHEEPYGYSRQLEPRMDEFFRRFLWASRVTWEPPQTRRIDILDGEGLEATAVGRDPVQGNKVFSRVIFAHRGERVVAFYFTQWRRMDKPFNPGLEEDFRTFVNSFRYLKPSFYESL